MALTLAQRRTIQEIEEISADEGFDPRALVKEWEGSEFLTTILEVQRRDLIRSVIVHEYTFIDELLGSIIAKYFVGSPDGKTVWRTKRFQRFNYFILERLYLFQKLALVKDIRPLPREVVAYIEKLNDLRNAVAHAFFPENLRGQRTMYKKLDVFTIEGFQRFREDRESVVDVLFRRACGR